MGIKSNVNDIKGIKLNDMNSEYLENVAKTKTNLNEKLANGVRAILGLYDADVNAVLDEVRKAHKALILSNDNKIVLKNYPNENSNQTFPGSVWYSTAQPMGEANGK